VFGLLRRSIWVIPVVFGLMIPAFLQGSQKQRAASQGNNEAGTQAAAADKIGVADLERVVVSARNKPDKAAAKQIGSLSLSERINGGRFEMLSAELPGEESRTALLALADAAEFLDLPAADIPPTPPLPIDEQRAIVVRAVQFALNSIHQMPNLLATRKLTEYQHIQPPQRIFVLKGSQQPSPRPDVEIKGPFRQVGQSQVAVVYRDGHEVVENQPANEQTRKYGVTTRGEFGELLRSVIGDMAQGEIRWSHWEEHKTGRLAVFAFDVPKERAHYQWTYCCSRSTDGKKQLVSDVVAYHSEIAIDPDTGAVLRLVVKTEPDINAVLEASELVEYGPVEIGGRVYMCPVKNVVLFVALIYEGEPPGVANEGAPGPHASFRIDDEPLISIALNHASFENYHIFRSEVRILPDAPQESPAEGAVPATKPDPQKQ
jgi:hypothetical protein